MRRDVSAVLMVLLGGAILRLSVTDAYVNYVKPAMKPYLVASAGVLLLLGVMAFIDAVRDTGGKPESHRDPTDGVGNGHSHGRGRMRSAWLLVLPVAAIFLVAPGPLGAYTAAREGASVSAPRTGSEVAPLPPGDPVPLRLDEFAVRAVWDNGRTLTGRTVEVVGFVTPDPVGGWALTRLALACCAADALATKVKPVGEVPDLPANTWVAVTGRYVPGGGTGTPDAVPWLQVDTIIRVPQPEDPYL